MAFVSAMDAHPALLLGENGSAELTSSGNALLDLFFALVRDLPDDRLSALVSNCFAFAAKSDEATAAAAIADLFVIAFQTRDCRGGKGERALFTKLFVDIAARFPQTAIQMLPLVPRFGYWKDVFLVVAAIDDATACGAALAPVRTAALKLCADQLHADLKTPGAGSVGLSLLGKWAPREKSGPLGHLAKELAALAFPNSKAPRAEYRKAVGGLNRRLSTVEVHMCGASWEAIEPSAVPSLAMMRARKALLNEALKGAHPTPAQAETGNRHPEDEGRVACRKRVKASLLEGGLKKLKGAQLFPHEIAAKCMRGGSASSELEREIFNAQWGSIRDATRKAMEEAREAAREATLAEDAAGAAKKRKKPVDLGALVALVDVSGSMSGQPMEVAIALGILVSELADPCFADRVITFHEQPTWCKFEPGASVASKVAHAQAAPWGGSTNFAAAMEMILEVCVAHRLPAADVPDLIVFSDMQFDCADRAWETHHARVARRFAEEGRKATGEPWPAPGITYWNLRGGTRSGGLPAGCDEDGVRLLSGFSPALLKLLLAGRLGDDETEEAAEAAEAATGPGGGAKKKKANPLEVLRKALDAVAYDDVRLVLAASKEGTLAPYSFVAPVGAPEEEKAEKAEKAGLAAPVTAKATVKAAVCDTARASAGGEGAEEAKEWAEWEMVDGV